MIFSEMLNGFYMASIYSNESIAQSNRLIANGALALIKQTDTRVSRQETEEYLILVFGAILGLWKSDKVCYKFDCTYY